MAPLAFSGAVHGDGEAALSGLDSHDLAVDNLEDMLKTAIEACTADDDERKATYEALQSAIDTARKEAAANKAKAQAEMSFYLEAERRLTAKSDGYMKKLVTAALQGGFKFELYGCGRKFNEDTRAVGTSIAWRYCGRLPAQRRSELDAT